MDWKKYKQIRAEMQNKAIEEQYSMRTGGNLEICSKEPQKRSEIRFNEQGKVELANGGRKQGESALEQKMRLLYPKETRRQRKKRIQRETAEELVKSAQREHGWWKHPRTRLPMITNGQTMSVSREDNGIGGICTQEGRKPPKNVCVPYNRGVNWKTSVPVVHLTEKGLKTVAIVKRKPYKSYKTVWWQKTSRKR